MRLLVLGGTVFLSRELAAQARDRGHEVTCVARGVSGDAPDGVRLVRADRDTPDGLAALTDDGRSRATDRYDAVIDVANKPSQVRAAVGALRGHVDHWVYISSISVYADLSVPGGSVATTPLLQPAQPGVDETDVANFGACKVACENAVRDVAGDDALIVRPGLIVGPGDQGDRFAYWPVRLHRGGEVLVPRDPGAPVQVIDVRDLARWIVASVERRATGVFDVTGAATTWAKFLGEIAAGVGVAPQLTWVPSDFLLAQGVKPWSGKRSLPVWLPLPEYRGMLDRDVSAAFAAGLTTRPLKETARDTLAWRQGPAASRPMSSGITADDEAALLALWRRQQRGDT